MLIHDIPITNIKKNNSLDYDDNCNYLINKFDIICTNPPFGGADDIKINCDKVK
jgi:type I restriction-modification system DNA methylase subunit